MTPRPEPGTSAGHQFVGLVAGCGFDDDAQAGAWNVAGHQFVGTARGETLETKCLGEEQIRE